MKSMFQAPLIVGCENAALIAKYLRSITAVLTVSIREERRPKRPNWCNRLVRT